MVVKHALSRKGQNQGETQETQEKEKQGDWQAEEGDSGSYKLRCGMHS